MMLAPLLYCVITAVITATLSMSGPLLIKEILSFIKKTEVSEADQTRAFWMAGTLVIAYFFKAIFAENTTRFSIGTSVRVGNIISLSIYDKLMSVSKCYRRYLSEGEYMSYLDTDQKVIVDFIRSIPNLSQAITIFILAQILLCLEVGIEGLCLLAVIVISLGVEFIMDRKQARLKLGKLQFYKERIVDNIQMYSELKQIKSLGWEDIIP